MTRATLLATTVVLIFGGPLCAVAEETNAAPATMSNNLKIKFIDQNASDRLGSKLIGTSIQNKANESIGAIADIVLDDNNKIKSYIVSVGGFLGIGTKYVAIDPSVVQMSTDKDDKTKTTILIDTDKDQLKAAPEYRYLSEQDKKSK